MSDLARDLSASLRQQIEDFAPQVELKDIGTVLGAGDGIATVSGLAGVGANELVEFENGILGMAFNLGVESVGVIILGSSAGSKPG